MLPCPSLRPTNTSHVQINDKNIKKLINKKIYTPRFRADVWVSNTILCTIIARHVRITGNRHQTTSYITCFRPTSFIWIKRKVYIYTSKNSNCIYNKKYPNTI